jgi:hypothetical protein
MREKRPEVQVVCEYEQPPVLGICKRTEFAAVCSPTSIHAMGLEPGNPAGHVVVDVRRASG